MLQIFLSQLREVHFLLTHIFKASFEKPFIAENNLIKLAQTHYAVSWTALMVRSKKKIV